MRHAAPRSARTQAEPEAQDGPRPVGDDGETSGRGTVRWQQLPYFLVLVGTVAALVTIRLGAHHLRSGTLVLAGVLLAAAVARLVLPDRRLGLLSSRRRWVDVLIFAAFGIGLLFAGLAIPAPG
jgi:hypothetical protein